MIRHKITGNGAIRLNLSKEGEPIEQKMERMLNSGEKLGDGAPLLYTERKEGVRASTNIRTDRFVVAVEAADKIAKSYEARRQDRQAVPRKKDEKNDAKGESTQGKSESDTNKA